MQEEGYFPYTSVTRKTADHEVVCNKIKVKLIFIIKFKCNTSLVLVVLNSMASTGGPG